MGFLDRLHGFVTGAGSALQAPFGFVKDVVTAPWDDDINGGIINVMFKRGSHRFGQMGEGLMSPNKGLGSALGALPEFVRDPVRTVTQPILKSAEWVYREGIAEPVTTVMTSASMLDAGHGFNLGESYKIAQNRSPGQAVALAITTDDILDEVEVEKAMGSDTYKIVSGLTDAAFRMTMDPLLFAGKAIKLGRGAALGRPTTVKFMGGTFTSGHKLTSAKAIREAAKSKGAQRFVTTVEQWADELGAGPKELVGDARPLHGATDTTGLDPMDLKVKAEVERGGQAGKLGAVEEPPLQVTPRKAISGEVVHARRIERRLKALDEMEARAVKNKHRPSWQKFNDRIVNERTKLKQELDTITDKGITVGPTEKLAERIRDQVFPDHTQGGLISYVLAEAAKTGDVGLAMKVIMGDAEAAMQVASRNTGLAEIIAGMETTAAEVMGWGENALQANPGLQILQQANQKLEVEKLGMSYRLEKAYAAVQETPRISKMGEIRHAAKQQTWIYQKGPLSSIVHRVFDMEPVGLLKYSDPAGDVQLSRMLRNSPFSAEEAIGLRQRYARALDPAERQSVMEKIEDEGIRRLTDGMHPDDAAKMMDVAKRGRAEVDSKFQSRKYDAEGRSKLEFEGEHGKMVEQHYPIWVTQTDRVHQMANWKQMMKFKDEIDAHQSRFGRGAKIADDVLEKFYHIWKPAVLLRAGWPIRVVGDEQMRILAKIGALAHGEELLGGMKESVKNVLGRVPKSERATYYAGKVKTRRNYEVERSFGTPGELENIYKDLIDSRVNFEAQYGSREMAILNQLRSGQWKSYVPGQVENGVNVYAHNWELAVNGTIGTDVMGRMFLRGKTKAEVLEWMKSSSAGRKYASSYAHRANALEEWVDGAQAQIDAYLPTQELRDKALSGHVSHADLMAAVPDTKLQPLVHGEQLKQAIKGSVVDEIVSKTFAKMFEKLGQMPTNKLSRSKYFDHTYRQEAERLVNLQDELAESQGRRLSVDDLDEISNRAREYALGETNKLLYNLAERSQLAATLNHISPFFMAQQEVLTRWTGLAIENPEFVARMRQVWMAPERAGLVVDENGQKVEWTGVDHDEIGKERYIVFNLHDAVKDLPLIGRVPNMKFNKDSFNTIIQGAPGLGPPVQMAINEIIKDRPTLEDSLKFVMPFGAQQGILNQFLPTTMKRAMVGADGEENKDYLNSKMRIFNDMQVDYALGKREEPPTWAEAEKRTKSHWHIRTLASFVLPAQPTFMSPYQMYIDAYRKRKDVEVKERQAGKPEKDIVTADAWFLDTYGEEYFALTQSVTKSMDGINPTREGYAARKKYQALVELHPELGGLIVGNEGAGEFSSSVYKSQTASKVSSETSDMQRRSLSLEEFEAGPTTRLGWMEYGKLMDLIDVERVQRKLPNLQVKGANDLRYIKQQAIANLVKKYPEWGNAFYTRDSAKWEKKIAGMRDIVNANEYPELQGREEIKGLAGYLKARDAMVAELKKRDADGGAKLLTASGNRDLANMWDHITGSMVANSPAFSQLYFRYLEFDPVGA